MARQKITGARLTALRSDWLEGHETLGVLERRYRVSRSTIARVAERQGWPPHGSAPDDTVLSARLLYGDLAASLRDSLERMRARDEPLPPTELRELKAQIVAHQRTLSALLTAQKDVAVASAAAPEPVDYQAAYERALAWLDQIAPEKDAE